MFVLTEEKIAGVSKPRSDLLKVKIALCFVNVFQPAFFVRFKPEILPDWGSVFCLQLVADSPSQTQRKR